MAKKNKGTGIRLSMNALLMLAGLGALSVIVALFAFPSANIASAANETGGTGIMETAARNGSVVEVDYIGTLGDGTMFDTSIKEEAERAGLPLRPSYSPLKFTVGAGQMIKGFDDAVAGMKAGEEKTITIAPADAYGEVREDLLVSVSLDKLPQGVKEGSQLVTDGGMPVKVVKIGGGNATVDFNHPLAGQSLTFKIIMRSID